MPDIGIDSTTLRRLLWRSYNQLDNVAAISTYELTIGSEHNLFRLIEPLRKPTEAFYSTLHVIVQANLITIQSTMQ